MALQTNQAKPAKPEKSIGEMFSQKQKDIKQMAMNKDESIDRAGRLTNATNFVIAFPDNWQDKLKEIAKCARVMGQMKEDNFIENLHSNSKEEPFEDKPNYYELRNQNK